MMESSTPPGRKPVRPTGGCFVIETPLTTPFNALFAISRIEIEGFCTVHARAPLLYLLYFNIKLVPNFFNTLMLGAQRRLRSWVAGTKSQRLSAPAITDRKF